MPTTRRLSAAALSALASLVLLLGAFAGVADARPNPAPPAFKACDNTEDTPAEVPFCDDKDDDSTDDDESKQEEDDESKQEEDDESKQEEDDEDESKDEDEVQGQEVIRQSNDGSGSNPDDEQSDGAQGDDTDVRGASTESSDTSVDDVGVAGASESAPTNLPRTGVGSLSMLLAALGMMTGGFSLTQFARRQD